MAGPSPTGTDPPPTCCKKLKAKIKPTVFLKIFQIVSVSISFGLFRGQSLTFGNGTDPIHSVMTSADVFCSGIMVAEFIITPLLILCHYVAKLRITNSFLEPVIHILFCSLSLISGFIGLGFWHSPPSDWQDKKAGGITMLIFCFVTAVLYFLDILVFLSIVCKKPKPQESRA